jgi:hypothetical protein
VSIEQRCRLWVISGQAIPGQNRPLSAMVRKRTNALQYDQRKKKDHQLWRSFRNPIRRLIRRLRLPLHLRRDTYPDNMTVPPNYM